MEEHDRQVSGSGRSPVAPAGEGTAAQLPLSWELGVFALGTFIAPPVELCAGCQENTPWSESPERSGMGLGQDRALEKLVPLFLGQQESSSGVCTG